MGDNSVAYKGLIDKSLQCIHLARTIQERYSSDATKITAEDSKKRSILLKEAARLKELAQQQKQQDELDAWSSQPDQIPEALQVEQLSGEMGVKGGDGTAGVQFAQQAHQRRQHELFAKAIRHGTKNEWFQRLDAAEKAALVEDATGEIIVPHDIAGPIFKTLPRLGIFRQAGPTLRNTTSNKVDLRSMTQATAGWGKIEVLGTTAVDANVVPVAADVVEVHDLMAMSRIGVDELQDTDVNLVTLIQGIVAQQMAMQEDDAFGNGNGVSKPWGLAFRATQGSPLITQAVTGTAQTPTMDGIKALPWRVPARFRQNGAYFVSADAAEALSLLKDSTSNYLWQPSVRAGEPDTLNGKRVYVLESLPSMTGTTTAVDPSVIFGDPELGYLVADRQRITMQRLDERFAEIGLVAFIFKLRVGGDVMRPAAFAKYLL